MTVLVIFFIILTVAKKGEEPATGTRAYINCRLLDPSISLARANIRRLQKLVKQHGPLSSFTFGRKLCVIASSPKISMQLLKDDNFSSRSILRVTQVLGPNDTHPSPTPY